MWEVGIKTSLGRPDFVVDPGRLRRAVVTQGFVEMPITASHVVRVATRSWIHHHPFDRVVAQAIEEKLTLLTADAVLEAYGRFVKRV